MEPKTKTTSEEFREIRYIIFGCTRSGTTVVHLAVAGHPNVVALNDEMKIEPFFTKGISSFTYGNDFPEEKERGYSALFNALTSLRSNDDLRARGVKIACNSQHSASTFVDVLQSYLKDIKVIIMNRQDVVALYGSAQHGKKSGIMHSWHTGTSPIDIKKVKISKWRFIAFYIGVKKMYAELDTLKTTHDVLEVNYEELLDKPLDEYNKVFNFLKLPAMEPTWLESKKVLPPPSEYIVNYHEMTVLLDKLKKGTVPSFVIWGSRLLNHLSWRIRTFMPKKK